MIESAEEFVRLRTSEIMEEYIRAAHESAPIAVWLQVIECYPDMKPWVIHNKTVPIEILELLSSDPDPDIRSDCANKRKLSLSLFERLSRDPDEDVRSSVARNAKTPIEILERLACDPEPFVRNTALEVLAKRQPAPSARRT